MSKWFKIIQQPMRPFIQTLPAAIRAIQKEQTEHFGLDICCTQPLGGSEYTVVTQSGSTPLSDSTLKQNLLYFNNFINYRKQISPLLLQMLFIFLGKMLDMYFFLDLGEIYFAVIILFYHSTEAQLSSFGLWSVIEPTSFVLLIETGRRKFSLE